MRGTWKDSNKPLEASSITLYTNLSHSSDEATGTEAKINCWFRAAKIMLTVGEGGGEGQVWLLESHRLRNLRTRRRVFPNRRGSQKIALTRGKGMNETEMKF